MTLPHSTAVLVAMPNATGTVVEGNMQWLLRIVSWRSNQPAMIRWLAAFALFGVALAARFFLGMFYGGLPALAFYPVLLIVAVLFGWKEALAVLGLSVIVGY